MNRRGGSNDKEGLLDCNGDGDECEKGDIGEGGRGVVVDCFDFRGLGVFTVLLIVDALLV